LKQVPKEFKMTSEGILVKIIPSKMTSEGILVKIIPSLDWGDLDFLLSDRLARDQGDQHRVKHQFLDKIHVDAKL